MLTIKELENFGADTKEGLARCLNNEQFYFRLIRRSLDDENYEKLRSSVCDRDYAAAFEAAHALKGVLGNLSLTPLYNPIQDMTELLRVGTSVDYTPYIAEVFGKLEELKAICAE